MSEAAPEVQVVSSTNTTIPVPTPPVAAPAPSETPTGTPAPEAAASGSEAAPEAPAWDGKVESLPPAVQDLIKGLRSEAAEHRVKGKTAADEAVKQLTESIGKALGLVQDDTPPTPEQLTSQLTASQQETAAIKRELTILRAVQANGLNADAILDSRSVMDRVNGIDPSDTVALNALVTELASDPRFKVAPAAPAAGGADLGPGGQAQPRIYTQAQLNDHDFYMKNRADIQRAIAEGRIR